MTVLVPGSRRVLAAAGPVPQTGVGRAIAVSRRLKSTSAKGCAGRAVAAVGETAGVIGVADDGAVSP